MFLPSRSESGSEVSSLINRSLFQNISFSRLPHSDALTTERVLLQKTIGSLEMIRNRASSLEVQTFSIRFPFDSTFNEVIEKVSRTDRNDDDDDKTKTLRSFFRQ